MGEFVLGHAPREHDGVDRKFPRPEVGVKKVNGENETRREECFLAVHDEGHVEQPGGEIAEEEGGKPEH